MGKGLKPETRKKFTKQELSAMIEDCFLNNCGWLRANGKCNNPYDHHYHEECPFNDNDEKVINWGYGYGLAENKCEEFQSR